MKDFLTSKMECYLLQRLNELHNRQKLTIGDLLNLHNQGKTYGGSPAILRMLEINGEINGLLTRSTLLAEINEQALQWGAIPPEIVEPTGKCPANDMVTYEEVPF